MTLFFTICALLAAIAVVLLVWPLLRPVAEGVQAPQRSGISATIVAALLPLVAFAIYFWASNWSWDPVRQAAPAPPSDLQQMVAQLRDRLSRQPDDLMGWKLLGRSAAVLGDFAISREAFGKAYTLSQGQDVDAIVGYAESLVANDEREIDGHAAELFEQALVMAPDNTRALWYGGIIAFRRGDLALAQQRWIELQNHELPPDLRQVVAERLSEVARARGQAPPAAIPSDTTAQTASAVTLRIDIAPSIAGKAAPGSSLFVIARRGDSGPPLAVVRRAVGTWPLELTVTDADAMLPGIVLADGGPIRVIARISRKGEPIASSGDLYGEVGYDFSSASPVNVTIDRIVP